MPLTTCKKCSKICSASDKTCPYCGASLSQTVADNGNGHFKTAMFGFFAGFLVLFALIFTMMQHQANKSDAASVADAGTAQNCLSAACPAGTRAVTYPIGQEPYYTCKSRELSDYANYALNVMLTQVQLNGGAPRVSPKTGEPDVRGKEKAILDQYRANAGVSTFEEAMAKCYKGIGKVNVIVQYYPEQGDSLYVSSEKNREEKFWLPKSKIYVKQ